MQRGDVIERLRDVKTLSALTTALLLVGCATAPAGSQPARSAASPVASAAPIAEPSPTAHPLRSADTPQTAADLLDCDGPISEIGGRADDFGPEGAGSTADEAFAAWMGSNAFGMPQSGWRELGNVGDRYVYAYETDGRAKVIVVMSPRFGELVGGAPFTIEEMRTCDPSEYGATVDLGPGQRVWAHDETGEILIDIAGPGHCAWESARMLHLSNDDGSLAKQYLRDPLGVFLDIPSLLDTYAEGVGLPAEATFSGYRTEDGLELWFTPQDRAAYVVTPNGVERWPRAEPAIGCA